ncbi:hypothetical protein CR513_57152, partial [Mucuna pruriens]
MDKHIETLKIIKDNESIALQGPMIRSSIFTNDIQCLFDFAKKLVPLKQIDHDMISCVAQA